VVHPVGSFEVEVSSTNAAVIYSGATSGTIRSSDGGVTFGAPGTGLPASASGVTEMVVDPQNHDTVYVATFTGGVYKSVDGGAHWTPAKSGLTAPAYYSLIIDPSNGATLYLGGAGAIYKTTDGGASWSTLATGLTSIFCYSLAISAGPPSTIVAGVGQGVLMSTDGGASWTSPKLDLATTVAVDPLNPANLLAVAGSVSSGARMA
jgi:photosystem II stability/assembly factor-like uncharacterized protein